ncbi:hypothetical protein V5N11_030928 [Cardamine amara subsp. amara]|uniref:Uncharacterized protein n=1 Tax=Cardamine amara subsp. amara TaxID=228776 RepID=A0ABD1BLB1_CARAN
MAFPISFGHFDVPDFSDHSPSCLVFSNQEASKKPFMFSHFLIKHKNFLPRVAQQWNSTKFDGTSMFVLSKKLKSLKLGLKELSKDNFLDLENRVKEAHLHLFDCQ